MPTDKINEKHTYLTRKIEETFEAGEISRSECIARLNDLTRISIFTPSIFRPVKSRIVYAQGIAAFPFSKRIEILGKVCSYDCFGQYDPEPFGEDDVPDSDRDFGDFIIEGELISWKIGYYDLSEKKGSEDPANNSETVRVLRIRLMSEW